MPATTRLRTHLRSAGTTYHGASSVEVWVERVVERLHVLRPQGAVVEVAPAELPPLVGAVDAILQPLALLLVRHVQEDLHDRGPLVREHALERPDVLVAPLPHALGRQRLHPHDEHVLVVAPVEHADLAVGRRVTVDPPEEVVGELLLARHAERRDPHSGRVDPGEDVAQHAVLAAGVHRLEHDQDGLPALGEQHLLELGQRGDLAAEGRLRRLLLPSELLPRVVVGEVERRPDPDAIEHLARLGEAGPSTSANRTNRGRAPMLSAIHSARRPRRAPCEKGPPLGWDTIWSRGRGARGLMVAGAMAVGAATAHGLGERGRRALRRRRRSAPTYGGHLVVSGEAEVSNPWTPAAMRCDSYCYVRARTFFDQVAVSGQDGAVHGWLAESIEPNDDFTQWTVTLRPGISFTDGTPLDAAAVIYNLQAAGTSILVARSLNDVARVPDPDDPSRQILKIEQLDDLSFVDLHGSRRQPRRSAPVGRSPHPADRPVGAHRLADLARGRRRGPRTGQPTRRLRAVRRRQLRTPRGARRHTQPGLLGHRRRRQPAPLPRRHHVPGDRGPGHRVRGGRVG